MENEYKILKNTSIKDFRAQFFAKNTPQELITEFEIFTNTGKFWGLFSEYVRAAAKVQLQKIYNETKIGKKIGNFALLKARLKQCEKNLQVFLEDERKNKSGGEFTEAAFVEWVAAVSKYYGYEIAENKSIFDFLVMSKKMNKDIEAQRQEFEKLKINRRKR